jgi:C-terminal processing protease CtpA/Prc
VITGALFSRGVQITTTEEANDLGQQYFGPVILITDALCYSATDLFAAGFQDHKIGPILGVDGNTGAGGANVWTHALLKDILKGSTYELKDLPSGLGMRVSIRRNMRVGEQTGIPIEDLGITPDLKYDMTKADLLQQNIDLINKASELLVSSR